VDKKIFLGAFILLIVEAIWLLADMQVIYIHGISKKAKQAKRQLIGRVEERHHTLKRKNLDSIVWEETNIEDPLYYLDSVLTLEQSSAKLSLVGNTQLTLSENTLVVLEPSENNRVDQLRVRFSRGDIRSRNPDRKVAVDTSTWTVEVEKGSEVSLRTKDSENIELEIHKGKVKVKEESQETSKEFQSGDVVKMNHTDLQTQKIDDSLSWITPIKDLNLIRKYSHDFPVPVHLSWKGHALSLAWENPEGKSKEIPIEQDSDHIELMLESGLHHFRLNNGGNTSPVLPVEVWRAPQIHTFWPLPRDRYTLGQDVTFSWSQIDDITQYHLNISTSDKTAFSKNVDHKNTLTEAPKIEGQFEWTVQAYDRLGFPIPHYYRSPIYFIKNPLAPPELEKPEFFQKQELRKPAQKRDSAFFNFIRFIIPEAHAADKTGYRALFKWKPVEGASFYVIEIDDEPNFKTPLVQQNTRQPEFIWEDFKLNTYYWRVAAEGKKGEKGLFSPVTPVDLTNPQIFNPPPEPVVKKMVEKPKLRVEKPKPKEDPAEPKTETKAAEIKPPDEEKYTRPIKGRIFYVPGYEYSLGSGSQNIKTSFTGINLLSADTQFDFPFDEESDITLNLAYRQGVYKGIPEKEYPFQEKLSRDRLQAGAYYGKIADRKLGLQVTSFQTIKRKSYEQVEAEPKIGFGPSVIWPLTPELEFQGGVLFGSESFLLDTRIRYVKGFDIGSSLQMLYGGELEVRAIYSTSYYEYGLLPKILLGVSW